MIASSARALLASILARMLWIRFAWWIFESITIGGARRTDDVIRRWPPPPPPLVWAGAFHSASTIKHGPDLLSCGFMPEVTFTPRVSVRHMCASPFILLAF